MPSDPVARSEPNDEARWRRALIAALANLMPSMTIATLGIALPEIRRSFSLSEIEAGSLFAVMMLVAAVTSAIAGRLADQFGPKTVLLAGLALLGSGFAGAGLCDSRLPFFLFLALTGIGYGFTPPSLYAIMSTLLPWRRGLGASLVSVCYGVGGAIGSVLSSRLTAAFGWRAAFAAVALLAASDMLLQARTIRNGPLSSGEHATAVSFTGALSLPVAILALAEFVGGSVFWSSAAWTPTLLRTAKELSLEETGWIMGLLSLANMLGSFGLGSLSDRLGRRRVIVFSAIPAALAAFVVFYWLRSPVGIAAGIFVFGTFKASVPALVVALAQEAAPKGNAGTASGIIMAFHYTAGVLAPLIAARLIGATGDIVVAMILVSSIPLVLYAALVGSMREPVRPPG